MRSGLQTPGAIPLLAMLVAALLSMMPIVCEAWSKPGRVLDNRDYHGVLADSSVIMSRQVMGIYLPAQSASLDSKNTSASRLIQPGLVRKDVDVQQISVAGIPIDVGVLPFPEKEVTWWQRVCRMSSLASVSFSNASPSSSSSSPALSPAHAPLPKQPEPGRASGSEMSMGAKAPQSAAVENSSSSLHNSIVDSSSPIERNGSFLAVMVSLIVAIMWF